MRKLRSFLSNRSGVAALEFALITPILVAVLVLGSDGWLRISQLNDERTGLQTGIRYYQTGGGDDTAAQLVAQNAWPGRPADGALQVVRSCTCGATPIDCASLCPGGTNPPSVFLTLTAQGTYSGMMESRVLTQTDVIRVR